MIDLKKIAGAVADYRDALSADLDEMGPADLAQAIARLEAMSMLLTIADLIPGVTAGMVTTALLAALKLGGRAAAKEKLAERITEIKDQLDAFFDDADDEEDAEVGAETPPPAAKA